MTVGRGGQVWAQRMAGEADDGHRALVADA